MAFDYLTLVGKQVRLDRGGPESRQGRVVSVGSDYVVIYNEKDGLVYYNTQHLKSMTQNTKDIMDVLEPTEPQPVLKIMQAENFVGLLAGMKNLWCQVNRGGHESVQGVVSETTPEYITMVVNHELVTIFTFHIKSISYGVKKENQDEKKEQKQDNNEKK
ncbi:hypothetical protein ACYEXS_20325 [Paenibacillus sp. MAH-36]|uniref:Spore coat protein B n=1 Tax=Paenibacillus violae TaxID=3077234 RepID=A0ABU3RC77_9BACL|nr:hypothetical protein [Paenibacillus sp. PFR10]MDU0201432.1 hypothetical protein [Paenibacillus sp. PFR10]